MSQAPKDSGGQKNSSQSPNKRNSDRKPNPRNASNPKKQDPSKKTPEVVDRKTDKKKENDSSPSDEVDETICFICADRIKHYAIGPCNHKCCFKCCLRSRALYKNKACPVCKSEQKQIVFSDKPDKLFNSFNLGALLHDPKLEIYFDNLSAQYDSLELLSFICPIENCSHVAKEGYMVLKSHVSQAHNKLFCDICVEFKKVFSCEHSLYTQKELQQHLESGTIHRKKGTKNKDDGFRGHPFCKFCKLRFYDQDAMFEHATKKHETCFLCKRRNPRDQGLYRDYEALEAHFDKDHFLCKERICLEERFRAFDSEIDFRAHEAEAHPEKYAGQRARQKQARQIAIDFSYSDRNQGSSNSSRQGRTRASENRSNVASAQEPEPRHIRAPVGFGVVSNPVSAPANVPDRAPPVEPVAPRATTPETQYWPSLSGDTTETIDSSTSRGSNSLSRVRSNPTPTELWPELPANAPSSSNSLFSKGTSTKTQYSKSLADKRPPLPKKKSNGPVNLPPPLPSSNGSTSAAQSSEFYIPLSAQEALSGMFNRKKDSVESAKNLLLFYQSGSISALELINQLNSLFHQVEFGSRKFTSAFERVFPDLLNIFDKGLSKRLQSAYQEFQKNSVAFPGLPSRAKIQPNSDPNNRKVLVIKGPGDVPSRPTKKSPKLVTSPPSLPSLPSDGSSPDTSSKPVNRKLKGKKMNWYEL